MGKVFVVARLSACLWEVLCGRLPQLWLRTAVRSGLCLGRAHEHLRGQTVRSCPVSFQVGWVGSNVGLMPTGQRRGLLAILATGGAGSMALSAASELAPLLPPPLPHQGEHQPGGKARRAYNKPVPVRYQPDACLLLRHDPLRALETTLILVDLLHPLSFERGTALKHHKLYEELQTLARHKRLSPQRGQHTAPVSGPRTLWRRRTAASAKEIPPSGQAASSLLQPINASPSTLCLLELLPGNPTTWPSTAPVRQSGKAVNTQHRVPFLNPSLKETYR